MREIGRDAPLPRTCLRFLPSVALGKYELVHNRSGDSFAMKPPPSGGGSANVK